MHDRTAAELASMRLRDTASEGVPRLEAVLDVFQEGSVELQIEIKTDAGGRAYPGLERRLLETVHRRRLGPRAIVTCFVPQVLDAVRAVDPQQRVLASLDRRSAELLGGIEPALDRFAAIEGCMVAVEKGLLSVTLDLCLRRLGGDRLGVWVPNEPEDIARWLRQPIRQMTTDRPDIALAQRQAM